MGGGGGLPNMYICFSFGPVESSSSSLEMYLVRLIKAFVSTQMIILISLYLGIQRLILESRTDIYFLRGRVKIFLNFTQKQWGFFFIELSEFCLGKPQKKVPLLMAIWTYHVKVCR